MKKALCILLLALTGCTTVYNNGDCNKLSWLNVNPRQWVLNNTPYDLRVLQDGVAIAKKLEPGQQVPVTPRLLEERIVVTITAHERETGALIGSDTWTFRGWNPEVWQVNEVYRTQQSR